MRNETHAVCRTSAAQQLLSGELQLFFDRGNRSFVPKLYEYVQDPTVDFAESGVVSQVSFDPNRRSMKRTNSIRSVTWATAMKLSADAMNRRRFRSQVKVPKGIPSGGIIVTVGGNNLQYIQEPKMFVRHRDVVHSSPCVVRSCPSSIF